MDGSKDLKTTTPVGACTDASPPGDGSMDAAKEPKTTSPPGADAKSSPPGLLPSQPSGFFSINHGQPLPPYSMAGDPSGIKISKGLRGIAERNTVATRPTQDPDRHCFRRSGGGRKAMKCEACLDYNKGVAAQCCQVCGHTNSVFQP